MRISNKNMLFYLIFFFSVLVLSFIFSNFVFPINTFDEIWNYGFCYNIYKGLIPYRDFSMIPTPLYSFVGSIFIKIFGEYLFSLHIFNAILISIIMVMLYKMIGIKCLFLYPLFLFVNFPTYNFLCLFLIFFIMYLIYYKKDTEILLGFVIGVMFLTKQNIGIVMVIPLLFYSKKKLKSICSFFVPLLVLVIYLIWNNALYEFIDYCFLGFFDFNNNNVLINLWTYLWGVEIICIIFLLYKSKFKCKELFYILFFQVMSYPIFDITHWFLGFIPFFCYIFRNFDYRKLGNKLEFLRIVFCVSIILTVIYFLFSYLLIPYNIKFDRSNYFYLRNVGGIGYESLSFEENIVNKYLNEYEEKYFIIYDSYRLKLYMNIDINKYDLLLDGNMGYKGSLGYIKEIEYNCSYRNCVFFVNAPNFELDDCQFSEDIYNFVIMNYNKIDSNDYFDVYSNG